MAGYYDPEKDYSKELQRTDLSAAERQQLETERSNKIAGMYGGVEPTMEGSDKKFSQVYTGTGGSVSSGTGTGRTIQGVTSDWDKQYITDAKDLAAIEELSRLAKSAAAAGQPFDSYHQAAEAIRAKYGYSGGNDGGGYAAIAAPTLPMMDFQGFLEQSGYDDYAEQTQAAIKAAVQQAIDGYNKQITDVSDDSAELARQAYIAKMLGQKNLDQELAAGGYAGGMADSQRIATEANYQNRLADLEKQKNETIRELEMAIQNAKLTGDIQTAQELSAYIQQLQGQWNSYLQSQQVMANQNYWNQQSVNTQTAETAYNRAMTLLSAGVMPDDQMLAAAGINRSQAQQLIARSTASVGSSSTKQTYTQTQEAGVQENAGTVGGGRFSAMAYENFIKNGDIAGADAYADQYRDSMTDAEKTRARIVLRKYGLDE